VDHPLLLGGNSLHSLDEQLRFEHLSRATDNKKVATMRLVSTSSADIPSVGAACLASDFSRTNLATQLLIG
jgi:hypothetical protein